MRSVTVFQAHVEAADIPEVKRLLDVVLRWEVFPQRVETFYRRERALELKAKLEGPEGAAWLGAAREFLAGLILPYQELIETTWGI